MALGRGFGTNLQSTAVLRLAQGIGFASRAWGQVGLGTIFQWLGRVPPLGQATCRIEFAPGDFFETNVLEPYWGPTVIAGRPYEPELMATLRELSGVDATFVDCGANFGYWTIVATGRMVGFKRAVAIEPNPSTYARLTANARANGDRFVCLQRAVSDRDGEHVTLGHSEHHAIAQISKDGGPGIDVETTTLDTALETLGWVDTQPIVLKIDVEGHEPAAIAGAKALRERTDHVIIFEDFARNDFPTAGLMFDLGYRLAYVMRDGRCYRVADKLEARRRVEADNRLRRPLNFVATKPGGAFDERISAWAARS